MTQNGWSEWSECDLGLYSSSQMCCVGTATNIEAASGIDAMDQTFVNADDDLVTGSLMNWL